LVLLRDNGTDPNIEVFTSASAITWNGKAVHTQPTSTGSLTGAIPVAAPIVLPDLTNWKHQQESPEAQPGFDDSSWQVADKMATNSVSEVNTLPVLYADLCRARHKSAYAEAGVMPTWLPGALVRAVSGFPLSA
jgi:hypothetical protein